MLKRILRSADPTDPTGNPPPPPDKPVAPPAAAAVIDGTKTEAEIKLESELKEERARHDKTADEKKQREIRISELEDELRLLRQVQSTAPTRGPSGFRTVLHDAMD
jgi:hypothetical protein